MDTKRVVIGTIVGAIVIYFLGELIWEVLFQDWFGANRGSATGVDREHMILWSVIVGSVLYALAMCLSLERAKAPTNFMTGIVVGAITGMLIWGTADFTMYGVANLRNVAATIVDVLLEGVRGGITGAILAIVGGFVSGKRAAA